MRRVLPTTMAVLAYRLRCGAVQWTTFWAGDSRCYLLEPHNGLQQLTRDDAAVPDALVSLIEDPPMTNYISADKPFNLHHSDASSPLPAILLCATDGFFGYVDTPAAFEYVLLSTMSEASSVTEWSSRLSEAVTGYTGDDASLSLVVLGWRDFGALQVSFAARLEWIYASHWRPVRELLHDRSAYVNSRSRSWADYRTKYEMRLPQGGGEL